MHEFLDGYYAPQATPFLIAHMQLYHAAVQATGWRVCASDNYLAPFFEPRAVTLPSIALIDQASAAVTTSNGSLVLLQRLTKLRLSPWFVLLLRWDEACVAAKALGMKWPLAQQLNASYTDFKALAVALVGPHSIAAGSNTGSVLAGLSANLTHTCV